MKQENAGTYLHTKKKRRGFRFFRDVFPVILIALAVVGICFGSAYVRAEHANYSVTLEVLKGNPDVIEGIGFTQEIFNETNRAHWFTEVIYNGKTEISDLGDTFRYHPDGYYQPTYASMASLINDTAYIQSALGTDVFSGEGSFRKEYNLAEVLESIPMQIEINFEKASFHTEAVNDDVSKSETMKPMYPVCEIPGNAVFIVERTEPSGGNSGRYGSAAQSVAIGLSTKNLPYFDFSGQIYPIGDRIYFTLSTVMVANEYQEYSHPTEEGDVFETVPMKYEGVSGLYSIDIAAYNAEKQAQRWNNSRYIEPKIELLYGVPVSSEKEYQVVELSVISEENGGRLMLIGREGKDVILSVLDGSGKLLSENRYEDILPNKERVQNWETWTFASKNGAETTWFLVTRGGAADTEIRASAWNVGEQGELEFLGSKIANPNEYQEYGFGRRILEQGNVWDAMWYRGEICLLMTGNEYLGRKHETSSYVLVPGEKESIFFGRFYNTMDEDGTVAAEKPELYGIYIGRYGCNLRFVE